MFDLLVARCFLTPVPEPELRAPEFIPFGLFLFFGWLGLVLFTYSALCGIYCEIRNASGFLGVLCGFRAAVGSVLGILGSFFALAEDILTQIYNCTDRAGIP